MTQLIISKLNLVNLAGHVLVSFFDYSHYSELTLVTASLVYRAGGSAAQPRAGQHDHGATPRFLPSTHCGSHCEHRSATSLAHAT